MEVHLGSGRGPLVREDEAERAGLRGAFEIRRIVPEGGRWRRRVRMLRDAFRVGMPEHQGGHGRGLFRAAGRLVLVRAGGFQGGLLVVVMEEPMRRRMACDRGPPAAPGQS